MNFKRTRNLVTIGALAALACLAQPALADDDESCFFKGTMYSDGAAACQAGSQYRCDEGEWVSLKTACPDSPIATSRTCQFNGISFSTGSASCQTGTQFRCEDGVWRTLGTPCSVGDSPIRVVPGGRTCMFGDATVSSNSTICRSGSTFLCSDGEWMNLGTLCR